MRQIRWWCVLAVLLVPSVALAAMEVSMNPPNREFTLKGGKKARDIIELENQGIVPVKFKVAVAGFSISPKGDLLFESSEPSAEKWITVVPGALEIKPYDYGIIRYEVVAPEGAPEGSYTASILIEEDREMKPGEKRAQFQVKGRFSHIVYVNVGDPHYQVSVESMSARADRNGVAIDVRIANGGNYFYRPKGTIKIEGPAKREVPLPTIPLLRGSTRTITATTPSDLPPGRYQATLTMEVEKKPSIQMTREFTVPAKN